MENITNNDPITEKKSIAVIAPFQGVGEKVLIGIADFFQKNTNYIMRPIHIDSLDELNEYMSWDFAGLILVGQNDNLPEAITQGNIPTIRVFDLDEDVNDNAVSVDNAEIGALAAQHLYGRGFKHFAFVGGIDLLDSKARYHAYKKFLDNKQSHLHLFSESFPQKIVGSIEDRRNRGFYDRLKTWLDALPKPVGIFASDDWKAFETHLAARSINIKIPDEIAIVGVNDDELACQISMPLLSSIRLPYERVGYEAASAIIQLIETGKPVNVKTLKPIGLVTRESTNSFAVTDQVVEQALQFMQRENTKPIRVEEVLKHVGVSRSLLERRFRTAIGRTPLVEMRRQRVERARALLADTDLAINRIAEMCGFASNIRFTTVFREQVGITPTEFRAQMRSLA